jgi:SAM-dependent MidA family methyltransferase
MLSYKVDLEETREHIELCPETGVLVEDIAHRISQYGGFSLIADYGHTGEKTDTFRVSLMQYSKYRYMSELAIKSII